VIMLSGLAARMCCSRRMRVYRKARRAAQAVTGAELAGIGLKRYQPGHVARAKALH